MLNVEDCEQIAKTYLETDEVSGVDFTVKPLPGANFELKIKLFQGEEEKNLCFFVKSTGRTNFNTLIDNFGDVLPNFKNVTPKVYHMKKNFVVFENLQTLGFQTCRTFNLEHLFAAFKALASLHAASFAFEEKKSKTSKFRLDKEHALLHLNFSLRQNKIVDLVSSTLENEEQASNAIKELEERQFDSSFRKTLCHGNLVRKNLMFKNSTTCKLINLKSNFYAPPSYDVLQLIFFNTSPGFRQHHWTILLDYYYDCIIEETKRHDVDITKILTIEDLHLSAHHILPLIKLEAAMLDDESEAALQELKEILTCPLLSREDCYVIVKNKLATTDYKFESFKVTPLSDVSGFLGNYHRVQIKVLHDGDKTINCFIKSTPNTCIAKEIAKDLDSFSREAFMYETIVPQMQRHGINTIQECLPLCYFYRPQKFMVFEDMSLLHYKNLDALKPLDFTILTLLTQTLAKFHACSLILEEKLSSEEGKSYRLIDVYGKHFTEPLFFEDDNHKGAKIFMIGIKSVLAAVDLLTEIQTDTNQRNFRKSWPKFKDLFYTVIKTSDRFRNVLCHGDLWTSNMMVRFQNGSPADCVLIDFQIVRYCPPAYDLLSVLHLTTDRSTRLQYEDQLIEIYYEELGRVLSSYGLSVESVYPYEDYRGCIEYMRPQMVMQAATDCVLTMCTPEEISSFLSNDDVCRQVYFEDRTEFLTVMCEKSALYRNRLKDCILDIYDYCNSMCNESE